MEDSEGQKSIIFDLVGNMVLAQIGDGKNNAVFLPSDGSTNCEPLVGAAIGSGPRDGGPIVAWMFWSAKKSVSQEVRAEFTKLSMKTDQVLTLIRSWNHYLQGCERVSDVGRSRTSTSTFSRCLIPLNPLSSPKT